MGLSAGDRVRVKRNGSPEGSVVGAQFGGQAYVRLDSGTAGNFPVEELDVLAPQTKAWPPEGIETK